MSLLLALALAGGVLDQHTLDRVGAHPAIAARLPGRLVFARTDGGRVSLASIAGRRPLVLAFADYTCRNVCAPGLSLTAAALARTGLVAGRDYRLAVVGLDPMDGPAAARAMAARIGATPALSRATVVLLGDRAATPHLAAALGYAYAYDAAADQFAHDASVYVFAADGQLNAVLPELGLQPPTLRAALVGTAEPATLADRVAHLCYGFAAAHGRYGGVLVRALQLLSATLLAGFGWWFWRRGKPA